MFNEQAIPLNTFQKKRAKENLCNPVICQLITDRIITKEDAALLDCETVWSLESFESVRELLIKKVISLKQVSQLTIDSRFALSFPGIRLYLSRRLIRFGELDGLDEDLCYNLNLPGVIQLIEAGILTVWQARRLNCTQFSAIEDEETRRRLFEGDLTIADLIDPPLVNTPVPPEINDKQSIHTASVNEGTRLSAIRLYARYGSNLEGEGFKNTLTALTLFVLSLPDDSLRNQAAKRCIVRMTASNYSAKIRGTTITNKQLLALAYWAILESDSRIRQGCTEDAWDQFIQGLYEIQRGYNLSESGQDDKYLPDRFICSAATSSKIIEKLRGLHVDCELPYITQSLASLKLPIVISDAVQAYLSDFLKPKTVEEVLFFTHLIEKIQKNGIRIIWDKIKDNVVSRMYDEFKSLYNNDQDPCFTNLINQGVDVMAMDFSCFQKEIQRSPGYKDYCTQMLYQSVRFFKEPRVDKVTPNLALCKYNP